MYSLTSFQLPMLTLLKFRLLKTDYNLLMVPSLAVINSTENILQSFHFRGDTHSLG